MLLVPGCGGGSKPTVSQFTNQADAICKHVNDQIAAFGQPTTIAQVVGIGPKVVQDEQRGIASLRKLAVPPKLTGDWRRILADLTQITDNASKLVDAARANDTAGAQRLTSASQTVQSDLQTLAQRDGLPQCAAG